MPVINERYYPTNSSISRIEDTIKKTREAANEVGDSSKYKSVSELQQSGHKTVFDNIVRDQTILHSYNRAAANAKSVLKRECSSLYEIKDMIDDFKGDTAFDIFQNNGIQPAEQFLTKLKNLLNSSDAQGRFIFGGKNQYDAPWEDLGNPTTVASDIKTVRISDTQTINTGLDANDPIFFNAITAVDAYKNGNKSLTDSCLKKAVELIYNALSSKEETINTIDKAIAANQNKIVDNEIFIENFFKEDETKSIIDFKTYETSLKRQMELLHAIQLLSDSFFIKF